jgi:hypothetical protein
LLVRTNKWRGDLMLAKQGRPFAWERVSPTVTTMDETPAQANAVGPVHNSMVDSQEVILAS